MKIIAFLNIVFLTFIFGCSSLIQEDQSVPEVEIDSINVINDPLVGTYVNSSTNYRWASIHEAYPLGNYRIDRISYSQNVKLVKEGTKLLIPRQEFLIKKMSPGGAIYYITEIISGSGTILNSSKIYFKIEVNNTNLDLTLTKSNKYYPCFKEIYDSNNPNTMILGQTKLDESGYRHFHYMFYNTEVDLQSIVDNNCNEVCMIDRKQDLELQCQKKYRKNWHILRP